MLRRFCNWLRSPSKMAIGAVILISALGGIFAWSGFNAGLAMTNTEEFCSDCHMNDVVPEYRASAHYSNRSGVKAICSDCHVPHEFFPKWQRKIIAAKEVYAHFTGKVDTKEKFEAHRGEMAEREWARMKANSSQECRNCHNFDDMDFTQQKTLRSKCTHWHKSKVKPVLTATKGLHTISHIWKRSRKTLSLMIC